MTCTCGPSGLPRRNAHDCPATVDIPVDWTLAAAENKALGWDALDDALDYDDPSDAVLAGTLATILDQISVLLLGYETEDYWVLPEAVADLVARAKRRDLGEASRALVNAVRGAA